jgi:hypothetical protein
MIPQRHLAVVIFLGLVAVAASSVGQTEKASAERLSADEQALKAAGISTDGPGLLEYFRRRTLSEAEQSTLIQRAGELGSATFNVRAKATSELIRAGRSALPLLRKVANHGDAETSRRARYCISVIEQNTQAWLSAVAARVLVDRQPANAAETLLAYLPFIDDAATEEDIRFSLRRLAIVDGKAIPAIEQALTDKVVKRRGAAAWIVGASSDPRQRQLAAVRLNDEASEVRFLAASALLTSREPAAVPVLIAFVDGKTVDFAWRAEDLLFRLAGDDGPAIWLNSSNESNIRDVHDAWIAWWQKNETKVNWKRLDLDEPALGLTLIVENQRPDGGSRIYETDSMNQIRWQIKITNPIDAQWLPGGRLLVGDTTLANFPTAITSGSMPAGKSPRSIRAASSSPRPRSPAACPGGASNAFAMADISSLLEALAKFKKWT